MAEATKTIDFPITNRWSGEVQFTAKIEADDSAPLGVKVGLAVKWAIANGANLAGANLAGADLAGANLAGANLAGANLDGANLDGANLDGASLYGASLVRAKLDGANLDGASLVRANLDGANLDGASLVRAKLDGASLYGANLDGANLDGANLDGAKLPEEALRPFKADMWLTLTETKDPNEVRFLIAALKAGAVDGSTYGDGKSCACLVGTLARLKQEEGDERDHDADRPAERWFMMIRPGDVPGRIGADGKETGGGFAARKALEWALAWCEATGTDPEFDVGFDVPDLAPVVEDAE